MNNEPQVESLHYEKGKLDMRLSGPHAMNIMEILVDLFEQNGGKNFLSMTMEAPGRGKRYDITITNLNGELSAAEKLQRLTEQLEQLRTFSKEVIQTAFDGGNLDGFEIQDLGVKHGLLIQEPYDPLKHCDGDCLPGDEYYVYTDLILPKAIARQHMLSEAEADHDPSNI